MPLPPHHGASNIPCACYRGPHGVMLAGLKAGEQREKARGELDKAVRKGEGERLVLRAPLPLLCYIVSRECWECESVLTHQMG
eukprot:2932387-Pyramimonas_sp.AAC.1